jgi:hypothetical protein
MHSRSGSVDDWQESYFCGFGSSHSGIDEDSHILEYYAMSTDKWSPTFRNTAMLMFLRLLSLHSAVIGLLDPENGGIFQIIQLNLDM